MENNNKELEQHKMINISNIISFIKKINLNNMMESSKAWLPFYFAAILTLLLILSILIYIKLDSPWKTGITMTQPAIIWEYKTIVVLPDKQNERWGDDSAKQNIIIPPEDVFNRLGQEGWELAGSYLETETAYPNFGYEDVVTGIKENIRPQRLVFIFKRLKAK